MKRSTRTHAYVVHSSVLSHPFLTFLLVPLSSRLRCCDRCDRPIAVFRYVLPPEYSDALIARHIPGTHKDELTMSETVDSILEVRVCLCVCVPVCWGGYGTVRFVLVMPSATSSDLVWPWPLFTSLILTPNCPCLCTTDCVFGSGALRSADTDNDQPPPPGSLAPHE